MVDGAAELPSPALSAAVRVWRARVDEGHRCRGILGVRQGWRCHWCGRALQQAVPETHPDRATLDHLTPVSQGGATDLANLVLACFRCNQRRGVMAPEAFRRLLGGRAGSLG